MLKTLITGALVSFVASFSLAANATFVAISPCGGANSCNITTMPPNPVTPNPNDGVLLGWDEVQNLTLTGDLLVDRVFDETADFITAVAGGFLIEAGTVISSHYLQWDPGEGSSSTVAATIQLDSQIFAFITDTQKLFDTDDLLGLAGLDYNDFGLRGLESGDTTVFNGPNVDINWTAGSPGDWTRLITAFSPGGEIDPCDENPNDPICLPSTPVPEPGTLVLLSVGFLGLGFARRKRTS